jgi:hypothetical protein
VVDMGVVILIVIKNIYDSFCYEMLNGVHLYQNFGWCLISCLDISLYLFSEEFHTF